MSRLQQRSPGKGRCLRVAMMALLAGAVPGALGTRAAEAAAPRGTSGNAIAAFGDATAYGAPAAARLNAPVVGMAPTPDGRGYWLVSARGGVFTYGDAGFYGSGANSGALAPFVGIAPTPDGKGYWLAGDFGNTYNFGDAPDESSTGVSPDAPVVGMAAMPLGLGFWLTAADGGVFSFGDAAFYGSMGAKRLNSPVVAMAATPDGHGYWLTAADGGVFSFGDAAFYGSSGGARPNPSVPFVALAATPDGHGYWLATTDKSLPPPTAVPSVVAQCNQASGPSVEPPTIVLACGDGNALLTHLSWSSWTATSARGSGLYTHNTCTPDCADGTFVSAPATVRLGYPVETGAGREFASISYSYTDPSAPGGSSTATEVAPTSPG